MLVDRIRHVRELLSGVYVAGQQIDADTLSFVILTLIALEMNIRELEERLPASKPASDSNVVPFPGTKSRSTPNDL